MKLLVFCAAVLAVTSAAPAANISDPYADLFGDIDTWNCGRRWMYDPARDPQTRIVGGFESQPYSWPWMCSLEYSSNPSSGSFSHICGASLVENNRGIEFILTAAHCVTNANFNAGRYRLRCGIFNRHQSNNKEFAQILSLKALYRHPGYSSTSYRNDIAIFSLNSPPARSPAVDAICISRTNYADVDPRGPREECVVTGWGSLYAGGPSPSTLQEVHKDIVSDESCRAAYGSAFDGPTMLCGGILNEGGRDACQGDSGGPLVVKRGNFYKLVGVVSWGYGCARPEYPGVYADVYALRGWINDIINIAY